jgi:uncharacterized membrane protein HdeD (DUF308 family)
MAGPPPDDRGLGAHAVPSPRKTLTLVWTLGVVAGAVNVIVGILLLVWTGKTLKVVAVIVGIELLIVGVLQIIQAVFGEDLEPGVRILSVLIGILALLAGLIVIRHPGESLLAIGLAVGIYLVLAGTTRLVLALDPADRRGDLALLGLLEVLAGVVVVSWPRFGIGTFAVVVGITLILRGLMEMSIALAVRRAAKLVE